MNESNVYEASYHLAPTLAEEGLSAEADKIKTLITDLGGEIISEADPELKTLAYSISKTVKAIKSNYNKAYFGWVKFALVPESVEKVKISFDASEIILRYLIVSTVREGTLMADKEKRSITRPEPAKEKENEEPTKAPAASEGKELDKAIDDLVIS